MRPTVVPDSSDPGPLAEALAASQAEHSLIVDTAQIGVIYLDVATGIVTLDGRSGAFFGLEKRTVSTEELYGHVHPDDRDRLRAAMEATLQPGNDADCAGTYRAVHADGTTLWLEARGRALFDDPTSERATRFVGTACDVTERQNALLALEAREARYRLLFSAIDEGYCLCEIVLDDEGRAVDYRFLDVNPHFEEMTGLVNATGRTAKTMVPNLEDHWVETYARVAQEGETLRFESAAESMGRYFDVFAAPVEPHGHFVLVFKDISERRRTEIALRESEAALRKLTETLEKQVEERTRTLAQSNRDLEAFAHVASHDLQEPLRKISMFSDILIENHADRLDAEARDYLARMQDAAVRLSTLVRALLAFSRLSRKPPTLVPVDLGQTIAIVLEDQQLNIIETGATIEIGTLPTVSGDAAQLHQLFQNLIANALKYRHDDASPRLTIWAETDDDRVTVSVRDNGIGFEPEYTDRIFEPFKRLHSRRAYPGTGIGLAICQRIAESHGGTLTATSVLGEGSTFSVVLPLSGPDSPAAAQELA